MSIFGAKAPTPPVTGSQAAIDSLAALDRGAGIALKDFEKRTSDAVYWLKDAEKIVAQRRATIDTINHERLAASISRERLRGQLEAELRSSAHPAIDSFVAEMWNEADKASRLGSVHQTADRDVITGRRIRLTVSNLASIEARMAACRAAAATAEALKLTEPDQSIVPGKLAALRAALPAVSAT